MKSLPLLTTPLAPCRWRGPRTRDGRYGCASPKWVAPRGVTPDHCARCAKAGKADHEPPPLPRAAGTVGGPVAGGKPSGEPEVRFRWCPSKQVYEWSVRHQGRTVDYGYDEDEADARAAVRAAVEKAGGVMKRAAGTVGIGPIAGRPLPPDWEYLGPEPEGGPRPVGNRHLLYHLLPVAGNGRWRWNVERLKPWLHLFDGLRLVAVMVEAGIPYRNRGGVNPDTNRIPLVLDPPEEVEAAFAGTGVEVIRVPNDPNLREVASHEALFGRLAEAHGPDDVALWAHAKGTTRHPGHVAERWTETLYEALLGHWPAVERILGRLPLAGCFKKFGPGWRPEDSRSDWHYSGSFFWVRAADLFARDWRRIDQFWSGIEPYPSQHFRPDEAGVVFWQGPVPRVNLYHPRLWDHVITPAWLAWKAAHRADRLEPRGAG